MVYKTSSRFRKYKPRVRRVAKVRTARSTGMAKRGLTKGQKQMVKKLIFKNREKKMAVRTVGLTDFNGAISSMADLYNLYPTVSQGTGEIQREGNAIRASYLQVRGHIQIDPSDAITTWNATNPGVPAGVPPLYATIFILRNKIRKTYGDFTSADLNILDSGSSYSQFDGTIAQSYMPINKDRYQVLMRKVVRLSTQYINGSTGAMQVPIEGNTRVVRLFSANIKLNKVLRYLEDDTQGTYPDNDNLFMCIGYVNTYSGSVDNLSVTKIKAEWQSRLYFTEY